MTLEQAIQNALDEYYGILGKTGLAPISLRETIRRHMVDYLADQFHIAIAESHALKPLRTLFERICYVRGYTDQTLKLPAGTGSENIRGNRV